MKEGGMQGGEKPEWQMRVDLSLAMEHLSEDIKKRPECFRNHGLQQQARDLIRQLEALLTVQGT
jgi:hypothetical protein